MSKRKSLTLSEKINLLQDSDKGMKNKEVARKYDIAPSSVCTILKNRDSICKLYETSGDFKKRSRGCKYEDVDEIVLQWLKLVLDKNLPVSGPLIREKAAEFASFLGHENFHASSGWLYKFKKRHRIVDNITSLDRGSFIEANITEWKDTVLKAILENYESNDIFNAVEIGLFFKCLPNNTLSFKDDKCDCGENSDERATVLVCTNMTGTEKLKLLVIGKNKLPRCLRGVKTLEADYHFNRKSWMTSTIFEKWIVDLDESMIKQKRNITLIINHGPAHPPSIALKLQNINMMFFPPNALTPMDHGVIENLKVHYRTRVLRRLVLALETNQSLNNVINLRISITELAKVWQNNVTELTIKDCFAKAGFVKPLIPVSDSFENNIDDPSNNEKSVSLVIEKCWNELQSRGVVSENISLSDFLNIDNALVTTEYPANEDISNSPQIKGEEDASGDDDDDDGDDDDVKNEVVKPSTQTMLAAFDTLRRGFQAEENVPDEIFQCLNKCEHFFEELLVLQQDLEDNKLFFKQ